MSKIVEWYKTLVVSVIGPLTGESMFPVPWFTKDIWNKLQWTAYIGDCQGQSGVFAFGLNLEFTDTWRRIRPRLSSPAFAAILSSVENAEWHWDGRPGYITRNPGRVELWAPMPVDEVNANRWLQELDDILEHRRNWQNGRFMRPQMQIMRSISRASLDEQDDDVREGIRRTINDLQPLVSYLSGHIK